MKRLARLLGLSMVITVCSSVSAVHAGTRLGFEAGLGSGGIPRAEVYVATPREESRQTFGYRLGGVADWSLGHGLGASVALRFDELAFGSHMPVASQSGGATALWSDRSLVFRQITFAPSASVHVSSRWRLHVTPDIGYLIAARQVDELMPGPALTPVGRTPIDRAPSATIFEQVGSRLDTEVTDQFQRVRLGLAADLSYEHPVGNHALRLAAGAHDYADRGESLAHSYIDWRTSLTWLH